MAASLKENKTSFEEKDRQSVLVWKNIILLSSLHILGIYSAYLTVFVSTWKTIIFALIHGIIGGIGVSAGAHRLWCHRSYKAKLPLRIILASFNCAAMQTPIYEWSRDHRVHHKFCETDADPHNSNRGFFFCHVGWLFYRKHPQVIEKGSTIDLSDIIADPVVRYQRRYHIPLALFFGLLLPTYVPMKFWNESLDCAFFVAAIGRYIILLHLTWCVNSVAHMYGYRPYERKTNARENCLVSLLVIGEGFHNYHHAFPWDYSISEFGERLNIGTMFIDLMAFFGLAYDLKRPSLATIEKIKNKNKMNILD